jgi:Fe-S-cluster containining protein
MNTDSAMPLCLHCGLCCSGVIFGDVEVQPEEIGAALAPFLPNYQASAGGRAGKAGQGASCSRAVKLAQPCAALDGCTCTIYSDRPSYCRQFECLVLKRFQEDRIPRAEALKIIQMGRDRAEKVRQLLRASGDHDEKLALARRFRRTTRRLQKLGMDKNTSSVYGDLTIAVHDLNHLLSEAFYPG